jgi:hypothetical protein
MRSIERVDSAAGKRPSSVVALAVVRWLGCLPLFVRAEGQDREELVTEELGAWLTSVVAEALMDYR